MSAEHLRIGRIVKELAPALAYKERVQIKDDGTKSEHRSRGQCDVLADAAGHHELLKINCDQMQADQQSDEQSEPPENDFSYPSHRQPEVLQRRSAIR